MTVNRGASFSLVFNPKQRKAILFFAYLLLAPRGPVAKISIKKFIERLQERHITLTIDEKVEKFIAEKGYIKKFGARPLKRAIQEYITVPLSQYLLKHAEVKTINVTVKDGAIVLSE